MNEYSDYQFYTPGEAPPLPTPWWRRRQLWFTALALIGVGVVVVLAVILARNILENRGQSRQQVADLADQLAAQCAPEDQACRDMATAQAARANGAPEACAQLTDQKDQVNCASLIAKDTNDVTACDALSGDARTACRDQASLFQAAATVSFEPCKDIQDPDTKANCAGTVWATAVYNNNCAALGIPSATCDAQAFLKAAEDSGDPAACAALLDMGDRADCNRAITSADEDLDGLVSKREFELGTNPQDPDTDDDGFSDGTEVQNGYDPLH